MPTKSKQSAVDTKQSDNRIVEIDPEPQPPTLLGMMAEKAGEHDEDEVWAEYSKRHDEWAARVRGDKLLATMLYAAEQWESKGLDAGKIMREMIDAGPEAEWVKALHAMTEKPEVRVRGPRQKKSRWTKGSHARLIMDVHAARQRKTFLVGPKPTVASACSDLVKKPGSEWYEKGDRVAAANTLARKYREASQSAEGKLFLGLLDLHGRLKEQGASESDLEGAMASLRVVAASLDPDAD